MRCLRRFFESILCGIGVYVVAACAVGTLYLVFELIPRYLWWIPPCVSLGYSFVYLYCWKELAVSKAWVFLVVIVVSFLSLIRVAVLKQDEIAFYAGDFVGTLGGLLILAALLLAITCIIHMIWANGYVNGYEHGQGHARWDIKDKPFH